MEKKYELAEEVLSLVYAAEDNIRMIRSPFSFGSEGKTRPISKSEENSRNELFDRAHIVVERYDKCKDGFNKLNACKYRFMAIYGKEHEVLFKNVDQVLADISTPHIY